MYFLLLIFFSDGRTRAEPRKMVDITRDKPIKVTIRVVVPVRDHPKVSKFNIQYNKKYVKKNS